MTTETHVSLSADDTRAWAAAWVRTLVRGTVVALHGDLGAGKTCFAQGMAQGLGVQEWVTSPTFALIQHYEGLVPFVHVDLYRLHSEEEAVDIGLEAVLDAPCITAIEWSERAAELLPTHTRHVWIESNGPEDRRILRVTRGATPHA